MIQRRFIFLFTEERVIIETHGTLVKIRLMKYNEHVL